MKATIALIGDNHIENYGRKLMLQAHRIGDLGFEMARLPHHVSLKQPFLVPSLEEMEEFFDEFAKELRPVEVHFEELSVYPNNGISGNPSGCLSIRANSTPQLGQIQRELFQKLEERFGPCPANFDNDYVFHMTIALGKAPFENYQKAYEALSKQSYKQSFIFNHLGLFYYDDDNICPGTYFCYKIAKL